MNWEAIGAMGEIVGAAAVVATLGYLAVQIRHSTKVARSATRQAIAEMTMSTARDVVSDGELAELLIRDMRGEELGAAQRLRLIGRAYVALRHYENVHYQHLAGMLSRDEWEGFRLNLQTLFETKPFRDYWSNERHFYSRTFQAEIEAIQQGLGRNPAESKTYAYVLNGKEGKS